MAIGSLPPNLDASKDREKWRKITPPERKRQSPGQSQILEDKETQTQSRQAQEEPLQSSGDTSLQPQDSNKPMEEVSREEQPASPFLQRTPSRGIWDWARAGTGRLNIIGRVPHPEWRGPALVRKPGGVNGETIHEAHDDYSIPSTTATNETAATTKMEKAGINNVISPSFAQTKRCSDDLVANTSSTSGTPESKVSYDEPWTNGQTTPSATSRDSPPSTPDTPTPQQRRSDPLDQPSANGKSNNFRSPTPQSHKEDVASESENASTPKKVATTFDVKERPEEKPASNTSSKVRAKDTSTPNRVPKYKIVLTPNLLSSAKTGAAST